MRESTTGMSALKTDGHVSNHEVCYHLDVYL